MSLKAVHLVFVLAISLLTFGCCVWRFRLGDNLLGGVTLAVGLGVVVYGNYFLKKLKNVSFL